MAAKRGLFKELKKAFEIEEMRSRTRSQEDVPGRSTFRVADVLRDFIYFNLWLFFMIITPVLGILQMDYVVQRGLVYVGPYFLALGMIYFKAGLSLKDWASRKWVEYKDF